MREELVESMEHLRMAAAHAAGGAAGAIAPRFEAARGRVEPTVNRSLDWLTETARDSARKANKTARKARNEKRGKSMAQRRWPMMVGGLLIAGAAANDTVQERRAGARRFSGRAPSDGARPEPSLEPTGPAECPVQQDGRGDDQRQYHRVAVLPVQLRHEVEVHAVDAGDRGPHG